MEKGIIRRGCRKEEKKGGRGGEKDMKGDSMERR